MPSFTRRVQDAALREFDGLCWLGLTSLGVELSDANYTRQGISFDAAEGTDNRFRKNTADVLFPRFASYTGIVDGWFVTDEDGEQLASGGFDIVTSYDSRSGVKIAAGDVIVGIK